MTSRSSEMETGFVTSIQDSDAIVELSIQESCESCGARLVCVPDQSGKRRLRAANPIGAKVGSQVNITEKSNFLLKVSFLQYGIPFLGFLLGIFLITGMMIAALISRYFVEKLAKGNSTFFEISKILN
jgi:positive regulator of sigma E activity